LRRRTLLAGAVPHVCESQNWLQSSGKDNARDAWGRGYCSILLGMPWLLPGNVFTRWHARDGKDQGVERWRGADYLIGTSRAAKCWRQNFAKIAAAAADYTGCVAKRGKRGWRLVQRCTRYWWVAI